MRLINEAKGGDVLEIADEVAELSDRYCKGNYGGFDYVGRRFSEALEFASALKKNKRLFNDVLANYKDVYAILEDNNYHTANLGLSALCDPDDFIRTSTGILKSYLRYL